MHKSDQSIHVNKPLLLICLFTFAILAATLMYPGDALASDAAPAAVARDAGHASLPVCNSFALKLRASSSSSSSFSLGRGARLKPSLHAA